MNTGKRPSTLLYLLLVFTALIVFFAVGYGLMSLIYRWTGSRRIFGRIFFPDSWGLFCSRGW